jgi:hypothetical protein
MTFADVDDLVRYYLGLDERLTSVPAQRLTQSAGSRCKHCGAMGTKTTSASLKRVCFACGHGWQGEDIEVPRTRVDGGATWRKSVEIRDDRIDLHRVLDPMVRRKPRGPGWEGAKGRRRWRFTLLAYTTYLQPKHGTYALVVQWGVDNHPRMPWTINRVRGAIRSARRVIEERARKEGLLPPCAPLMGVRQ